MIVEVPPSWGKQQDPTACQHFFSGHLSAISSIKTARLINAIQNSDCGEGSGHESGSSVGRSLLSESICGDVFAAAATSLSAREVHGALKAFPINKSTVTSCNIHSAPPL